ncbi:MAG: regulatory iron-sulfur-containing complex subunit RicT [Thermoguttaceae bacterium]|jgi:cell fate regulator YaaT (PSP1 superfamily)|nr:regulatory iron-sulfur-containing complex subunit RicT [Thermoguttaceae bacterium]
MEKYIVRYGAMRTLGVFECDPKEANGFFHGVVVLVKTPRGSEAGTILCKTDDEKIAQVANLNKDPVTFIRRLAPEDDERLLEIKRNETNDFNRCLKIVERMRIDLTLVRVEQIFGRERVVVYYVADGRVDFRELVRALAAEFQTRIEMKQIGVRDETKLLADVGDCGREVCCNTYLASMPPVSMKMAKLQKATLDPTKVSGRCGRLKCCLRYEFDMYNELQEKSHPIGALVWTPLGRGRVFAQELFAQRVIVDLDDGGRQSFPLTEVDAADRRFSKRAPKLDDDDGYYDRPNRSNYRR